MLENGTVIAEKYFLEEQIGEGGMAVVWRAVDMVLDRPVAVKFVQSVGADATKLSQRFLREARVSASVRHPNVVEIFDFGTAEGDVPYMVMELLEGHPLSDNLFDGPPLHVSQFVKIIAASLKGLDAAHDAGIVHRDLKPENIFLVADRDGSIFPKLIDFGISRAVGEARSTLRSSLPTMEGIIVGTPHYLSPEQARGVKDVDHRTDIYAMGVIVYEGLTGVLPFDHENVGDLLIKITTTAAAPVSTYRPLLGQPLSDVVERAMARDREARYQSALEMRDALIEAAEKTAQQSVTWGTAMIPCQGNPDAAPGRAGPVRRMSSSIRPPTALPAVAVGGPKRTPRSTPDDPLNAVGLFADEPSFIAAEEARLARRETEKLTRRFKTAWIAAAAAAAMGTAAGIGLLTTRGDAENGATVTVPPDTARPPETAEPVGDSTVAVTLRGVPDDAVVYVDGETIEGHRFELPRAAAAHLIEVRAEGFQTWRISHSAQAGGTYAVRLEPRAATTPVPTPETESAGPIGAASEEGRQPPRVRRGRRRAPTKQGRDPTGGPIRSLDF